MPYCELHEESADRSQLRRRTEGDSAAAARLPDLMQSSGAVIATSSAEASTSATTSRVQSDFERHYEELMRGSVSCPSCKGSGRIPKEMEGELVALIPMKDERLQPRRTKLYVAIAVCICAIIGGLALFFFLPRSVVVMSDGHPMVPSSVKEVVCGEGEKTCYKFNFTNSVNISNENYFRITVNALNMLATVDRNQLSNYTSHPHIDIPALSRKEVFVNGVMVLGADLSRIYQIWCVGDPGQHYTPLDIVFQFQVNSTFFLSQHSEADTLTAHQHLGCAQKTTDSPATTTGSSFQSGSYG